MIRRIRHDQFEIKEFWTNTAHEYSISTLSFILSVNIEQLTEGMIKLDYISMKRMIAAIMTKPVKSKQCQIKWIYWTRGLA